MLVLSRTKDERIIAGPIALTIVDVRGDKVRVGIDCDPAIKIYREEILRDLERAEPGLLAAMGLRLDERARVRFL